MSKGLMKDVKKAANKVENGIKEVCHEFGKGCHSLFGAKKSHKPAETPAVAPAVTAPKP